MDSNGSNETGSRLLKAVEAIAMSPESAQALAERYISSVRRSKIACSEGEIQEVAARKIVSRYARMTAVSGGATALAGVVPGIGTAIAMVGGGLADAAVIMKFQVDMVMCIAAVFGWDLHDEDAKHISFLISTGASLEKFGVEGSVALASMAGVRMLKQYLRGAALVTVKQAFARLGISFTRVALEKALPFGFGVAIGSSANFALTKYVGNTAIKWFTLDLQDGRAKAATAASAASNVPSSTLLDNLPDAD